VIVMDATGSMKPFITGCRQAIYSALDTLQAGGFDTRFGLVIFRDELRGEPTEAYGIGLSVEELRSILARTKASGGGDTPESSLPAISHALDLLDKETDANRVILHITDAPCHDPERGLTAGLIQKRLTDNGVLFHACSQMQEPYIAFTRATKGTLVPISTRLGGGAFEKVMDAFARATVEILQSGEGGGGASELALSRPFGDAYILHGLSNQKRVLLEQGSDSHARHWRKAAPGTTRTPTMACSIPSSSEVSRAKRNGLRMRCCFSPMA